MTDNEEKTTTQITSHTREQYRERLRALDALVCEAIAVSQGAANRYEAPTIGFSTYVFTRLCGHAQSLMCAVPLSRWSRKEFERWDISLIASHARSILEGYILFIYFVTAPEDLDAQRAYVQVMHMYDIQKRLKILPKILPDDDIVWLKEQAEIVKDRLENIKYFKGLDKKLQSDLLNGKFLMITPQKEVISASGIEQEDYDFFWNYLSQYTHVLSFSFHRIETEGRGTGIENDFDRDALYMVVEFCIGVMSSAVTKFVEIFPDTEGRRNGIDSKFSPGPARNLPKERKRGLKRKFR